jgi:hypothetical protein
MLWLCLAYADSAVTRPTGGRSRQGLVDGSMGDSVAT